MFSWRRDARPPWLLLTDAEGAVLFDGAYTQFQLPELLILRLSMEYFNDPEPCHIHRGAVLSRVFLELQRECEGRGALPMSSLPEAMQAYFVAYEGVYTVESHPARGL